MTSTSHPSEREGGPHRARLWVAVAVAIALMGVVGVSLWSPLFHARSILVSGERHLSRDAIVRLARISGATNLLGLDAGKVEARLEASRWIRSARVQRSLPSGVRIVVAERRPVAVIRAGSGYQLIAGDGIRLGSRRGRGGLPLIVADTVADTVAGAAGTLRPMPAWLRRRIERVVVRADGTLRMVLSSGVPVAYGALSEAAAKAAALAGMVRWSQRQGEKLAWVDVRFPAAPTAGTG